MTKRLRSFILKTSAALSFASVVASGAHAQDTILNDPTRLFQFETADVMPGGALSAYVGTFQSDPNRSNGTGNQVYYGGGSYALTDKLSFGLDFQSYRDPSVNRIDGLRPNFFLNDVVAWGKYQFVNDGRLRISALAGVGYYARFDADLWGGVQTGVTSASLKLPISYAVSDTLDLHFTPSVSRFPETIGGAQFYGTVASLGVGADINLNDRAKAYATVDVPVSGANNITSTASFSQSPVWTLGGRYLLTPKIAVDAYVTNGVGITPPTSNWTHWPDGGPLLFGAQLTYTPGQKYGETFRDSIAPVTSRITQQQRDGFTVASAEVLEPGNVELSAWYGNNGQYGGGFSISPDRDGQVDFYLEKYANDGSVPAALRPRDAERFMIGPKLRLLDQNNGDPFSLSGQLLFGRDLTAGVGGVGVFYLAAPASYQVNDTVTVRATPKLAAFGNTEIIGMGLGLNVAVADNLELIGEVTPVGLDASTATWAAGARYHLGDSGFSVDLGASNAIGRAGIGTMIAQDNTQYSISLTKRFDASGLAGIFR